VAREGLDGRSADGSGSGLTLDILRAGRHGKEQAWGAPSLWAATLSPTPFVPTTLDHPDGVVMSSRLLVFPTWRPAASPAGPVLEDGRPYDHTDPAELLALADTDPLAALAALETSTAPTTATA
jgi:hypothetical protein